MVLEEYSFLNPTLYEGFNGSFSHAFCDSISFSIETENVEKVVKFFEHYKIYFYQCDKGFSNYEKSYVDFTYKSKIGYGGISCLNTTGKPINRVYVSLTGSACRFLQSTAERTFYDLCERIVKIFPKTRVNRIDIAKDSFKNSVFGFLKDSTPTIRDKRIYSARSFVDFRELSKDSTRAFGWTLYIGKRSSSSVFIRIYDKLAEQNIDSSLVDNIECWHRMELEIKRFNEKNDQAKVAFNMILNGFSFDDIFSHFAYRRLSILKHNAEISKNKLQDIDKYINPSYKNFLFSYTSADIGTIHKTVCFANSLYCDKLIEIEKELNIMRAKSIVFPYLSSALADLTIGEIIEIFKTLKSNYRDKNLLRYQYISSPNDIFGKHNILNDIPFCTDSFLRDVWSNEDDLINPFTNEPYTIDEMVIMGKGEEVSIL